MLGPSLRIKKLSEHPLWVETQMLFAFKDEMHFAQVSYFVHLTRLYHILAFIKV